MDESPYVELSAWKKVKTDLGLAKDDDSGASGTTWISSMMIIIANVMGIGVLGLAHALSHLGWIWGLLLLVAAMTASVYSGLLLARMKQKIPSATIYADLGQAAYGNLGASFVTIFGYTYIFGICFSLQLSASLAFKEMTNGMCFVYSSLIVAAMVVPLAQYRNMQEMTAVVYVGAISIMFPVVIIASEIAIRGRYGEVETSLVLSDSNFNSAVVSCMDVLFAITGQVIFVEIMSEMKDPSQFNKSVIGASSIFFVVYTTMASVGYYFIGSSVLNPITDNLTDVTSRRWCASFVLCHIIVAYVMEIIILARAFERLVLHQLTHEDSKHATYRDRVVWGLVTTLLVFVSFVVCNVTPFINSLMGFVGAISGVTTTYVFPFLFAPVILQDELSVSSKVAHNGFGIFASAVALLGVYASVQQMITSFNTKSPFEC